MALPDDDRWNDFRRQMPAVAKWAYFDHAAVAPLPAVTRETIRAWADEAAREGDTVWSAWSQRLEETRSLAARLVGAAVEEIALVHSTTEGISLVAEGYPWQPGDNVVTLDNEFPSNVYPWLNLAGRGVETRRVPTDDGRVDLDRLAAACDARTRIIAVSWVGYLSGWRIDLDATAQIARRAGALLLVDAIQGLGAFPLDVGRTPIDFLAADGHKWLLAPEGAGLLYVRREHLDRLRPIGVGWNSVVHAHDFGHIELRLKPSASRYEGGSPNMVGWLGLCASLRLLVETGIAAIGERILAVTDEACRRIEAVGGVVASHREAAARSGIVSFTMPARDAGGLRRQCLAAGVALGLRGGRLRISPHAYCNDDDLDRLIAALA